MTGAHLVARTVRGIESILAEEIQAGGLGTVENRRHREVWFRHLGTTGTTGTTPGPRVLDLRCADDVFLVGALVHGVGRTKASLRVLTAAAEAIGVRDLQALRAALGGPRQPMSLDVSASFLGRRNFNRYDLEDAVGRPLAAKAGLPYHSRRTGLPAPTDGMSWRVTVEADTALLSLRIGSVPLHRRSYRRFTGAGSLHPPLAAAMVRLAQPTAGALLLDPCCGVGTIPIEAAGALSIIGSDHNSAAIKTAHANSEGRKISWLSADAGRLPLAHQSVDLVVTNPPWNRQVPPAGILACHPHKFWHELRRVLRPDGRAVVLLPDADDRLMDAEKAGLTTQHRRQVSLFGTHPEIAVLKPT